MCLGDAEARAAEHQAHVRGEELLVVERREQLVLLREQNVPHAEDVGLALLDGRVELLERHARLDALPVDGDQAGPEPVRELMKKRMIKVCIK